MLWLWKGLSLGFFGGSLGSSLGVLSRLLADSWLTLDWLLADSWLADWLLAEGLLADWLLADWQLWLDKWIWIGVFIECRHDLLNYLQTLNTWILLSLHFVYFFSYFVATLDSTRVGHWAELTRASMSSCDTTSTSSWALSMSHLFTSNKIGLPRTFNKWNVLPLQYCILCLTWLWSNIPCSTAEHSASLSGSEESTTKMKPWTSW